MKGVCYLASAQGDVKYSYVIKTREPNMNRMEFGAFLAPHHPIGENPTLQFRSDLEFVSLLDRLGFDEFWCG